jgi:hypothetical protein
MRTIDKIITKVNATYGAPMGRRSVGERPDLTTRVFDCAAPMSDGAYDKGGAYWGIGSQLRVSYTKDLSYIEFYRAGDGPRRVWARFDAEIYELYFAAPCTIHSIAGVSFPTYEALDAYCQENNLLLMCIINYPQ